MLVGCDKDGRRASAVEWSVVDGWEARTKNQRHRSGPKLAKRKQIVHDDGGCHTEPRDRPVHLQPPADPHPTTLNIDIHFLYMLRTLAPTLTRISHLSRTLTTSAAMSSPYTVVSTDSERAPASELEGKL